MKTICETRLQERFTSLFVVKSGKRSQEERISGEELEDFLSATEALNKLYNAEIITEFPFNALGILEKVASSSQGNTLELELLQNIHILFCSFHCESGKTNE